MAAVGRVLFVVGGEFLIGGEGNGGGEISEGLERREVAEFLMIESVRREDGREEPVEGFEL